MVNQPDEQAEAPAPKPDNLPPPKPRPKMTLDEQSIFLSRLIRRCTLATGRLAGRFASDTLLSLSEDDVLALEAVQQTIAFMDANDVQRLVRDEMNRRARARAKR